MALNPKTMLLVALVAVVSLGGCSKARKDSVTYCNHGIMAYEAGEVKEAMGMFEAAIATYPKNQVAHFQLGSILMHDKKDYAGARRELTAALELNPQDVETIYSLGRLELLEGNLDPAMARFQEALKYDATHAGSLYYTGVVFEKKGKLDEADEYYRKALESNPKYARAYNSLGLLYYETENYEPAAAVLAEGVRLNEEDPDLHQNLGMTYLTMGKIDPAVEELTRSIELDPNNATGAFNLANALIRQMRFKQATFYLRRFIVAPELQESDLLEPAKLTFNALQQAMAQGIGVE